MVLLYHVLKNCGCGLIMMKRYGYWMGIVLIFYVISVFYIISTLKLDVRPFTDKDGVTGVSETRQATIKRYANIKQNNLVIVESMENEESNPAVGRNILIENADDKIEDADDLINFKDRSKQDIQSFKSPKTLFKPIGGRFYVYSAYFDDRLRDSFIRIVAIGPRNRPKNKSGLSCVFENQKAQNGSITTDVRLSDTCENHKKLTSFYLMSCLVPNLVVKDFRQNSLFKFRIRNKTSDRAGFILTAVNNRPFRSQNNVKSHFSLCVPPLYGNPTPLHFVEFMELSMILGVEHFIFYNYTIGNEIRPIVKFYETQGLVTVLTWNIPDVDHVWNLGQSAAIADCIYRNMYKFQIVALNDIDEFIIPRNLASWRSMLAYLENQNRRDAKNVAAYRFKSTFFHGNTDNVTSEWRMFKTLNNILRTKTVSSIRTKLMVYPETVFELGIHHLSQPIKSHLKTINVDQNTALVHHYRDCQDVYEMNCGQFIEDYTTERYGQLLIENTRRVLRRAKKSL